MNVDDKLILGTPVLNFADVDREHNDLRETLEYADSSKLEIRDRAQGLLTALSELKEQRHEIEGYEAETGKNYNELVDALCSPSWLGRHRHSSVIALAKRLRDSQDKISVQ